VVRNVNAPKVRTNKHFYGLVLQLQEEAVAQELSTSKRTHSKKVAKKAHLKLMKEEAIVANMPPDQLKNLMKQMGIKIVEDGDTDSLKRKRDVENEKDEEKSDDTKVGMEIAKVGEMDIWHDDSDDSASSSGRGSIRSSQEGEYCEDHEESDNGDGEEEDSDSDA
jgi:hypothetical protein